MTFLQEEIAQSRGYRAVLQHYRRRMSPVESSLPDLDLARGLSRAARS